MFPPQTRTKRSNHLIFVLSSPRSLSRPLPCLGDSPPAIGVDLLFCGIMRLNVWTGGSCERCARRGEVRERQESRGDVRRWLSHGGGSVEMREVLQYPLHLLEVLSFFSSNTHQAPKKRRSHTANRTDLTPALERFSHEESCLQVAKSGCNKKLSRIAETPSITLKYLLMMRTQSAQCCAAGTALIISLVATQ